jgi:hypothetical protein
VTRPPSVFVRELSPDEGQRLRQLSRRHKQFQRSGRLGQPTRHHTELNMTAAITTEPATPNSDGIVTGRPHR